jgi:hypothetical protein
MVSSGVRQALKLAAALLALAAHAQAPAPPSANAAEAEAIADRHKQLLETVQAADSADRAL